VKVENILIDSEHNVKIIDFGLAVCPPRWTSTEVLKGKYFAPELDSGGNNFQEIKFADNWGIGCVLYYVSTGEKPVTVNIRHWNIRKMFQKHLIVKLKCKKEDEQVFCTILEQLLQTKPGARASFQDVIAWSRDEQTQVRPSSPSLSFESGQLILQKWPFRKGVPQALGMRVPRSAHGKTILELRMSDFGLLVVTVVSSVRKSGKRRVSSTVNADTILEKDDWIFFGVAMSKFNEKEFISRMGLKPGTEISFTSAKDRKQEDLSWFFPAFDSFTFKEQHFNAVIGPPKFAKENQNALNLRQQFKMNLCGIVNSQNKVEWWPDASKAISKGDRGLLMRVPNFIGKETEVAGTDADAEPTAAGEEVRGCSADIELLKRFLDPTQFYETLDLNATQMKKWKANLAVP